MKGHPKAIEVRGARKNNLKNVDIDIPLGCITGIAEVSGSGESSLAPRQRPGEPGMRSTFGTMTELLNSLRLMYSRLASHRCPNGHYLIRRKEEMKEEEA